MGVTHSFECRAHGVFEARVKVGTIPSCRRGCSPDFVKLVFLEAPNIGSERVKNATRLVREMADAQGLADIDISPSRPGDSVADRNYKKSGNPIQARAVAKVDLGKYIGAQVSPGNALTAAGFGHPYDAREWRTDRQTGRKLHFASPPVESVPMNQYGVEVQRVRVKR